MSIAIFDNIKNTKSGVVANAFKHLEMASKGLVKGAEEQAARLGAPFSGEGAKTLPKRNSLEEEERKNKPGTVVVPAELPGPQAQAETSRQQVNMVA